MRIGALIVVATVLAVSCSGSSPSAGHSPSASASDNPAASPSGNPSVPSYGLLLSAGTLEIIAPTGTIAAHATIAAPSVHTCGQNTGAVLQPPVSASDNKVYYRDGNTKIKFLTPDGETGDVTTVPGSASKVSFFSVSPDDTRIAVLVEDLSPATTIKLSLYVEDLSGHTNHSVIFTNTVPKFKNAGTLWPMGWHNGLLVLAVFPPCTFEPAGLVPIEWHVANAVTAVRVAKIGNPCIPSYWPSPAGVVCLNVASASGPGAGAIYDWSGKTIGGASSGIGDFQSGLSPSGRSYFRTPGMGIGAPPPMTVIISLGTNGAAPQAWGRGASVPGHSACLWIDEDHLLAPDAVIGFQSTFAPPPTPTSSPVATSTPVATGSPASSSPTPAGNGDFPTSVTALPASGICAGRFPGGL